MSLHFAQFLVESDKKVFKICRWYSRPVGGDMTFIAGLAAVRILVEEEKEAEEEEIL